jgi:DNA-binding MarR family transcriptional regulator
MIKSERLEHISIIDTSMHRIGRVLAAKSGVTLKQANMYTPSQWCALAFLYEHPDLTIKDIAKHMHCSSSAATQIVDVLVEKKSIQRKVHPKDKRSTCLSLSVSMKRDMQRLHKQKLQHLSQLFHSLSDAEVAQFAKTTQKLVLSLS